MKRYIPKFDKPREGTRPTNNPTGRGIYYSNGTFEAYAKAPKPEGSENKKAIVIGAGLAGLAAAFFLVRDAQLKPENIVVMEKRSVSGGSCDGMNIPGLGYVISGGREMDNHFECYWDMFRDIPSIADPNVSVLDYYYRLNKEDPNFSNCRVTEKQGQNAHTDRLFGLNQKQQLQCMKLFFMSDESLYGKAIKDVWPQDVFDTNFWTYYRTMFAFKDEHSALEVKKYFQRYIHHIGGLVDLSALRFCKYNNYESLVLPIENWLKDKGVQFSYHTEVTNVIFDFSNGKKTARVIEYKVEGDARTMEIDEDTQVYFTAGSNTANITLGDMHTVPKFDTSLERSGSWQTWLNIAKQDPSFGRPQEFLKDPELTQWESATVTTLDNDKYPEIIEAIKKITTRDPRDGTVVTGGIVTCRDSGWLMSWTINRQPHFREQDPKKQTVVWVYGLYTSRIGNYVKKPMKECTGEEITKEWLYHIGIPVEKIDELAANAVNTIPVMMPRVDTYFICRNKGDRPYVVPDGVTNFAFLGNHVECGGERETTFTTEMSIRTGMEGVYNLNKIDRAVPEVYGSVYDVRWLLKATVDLRDGCPLNANMELPGPAFIKKPLEKVADKGINKLLKKLDKTDLGVILRRYNVFDYSEVDD